MTALGGSLPGFAQSTGSFQTQQYEPKPGAQDMLGVQSSEVHGRLDWQIGLHINAADDVLEVRGADNDTLSRLIDSQTSLDLLGAVGLGKNLELGLVVPVTVHRSHGMSQLSGIPMELASAGFGDVRLVPKLRVPWPSRDLALAVSMPVSFPTGKKGEFLSNESISAEPRIIAEYHLKSGARVAANLGLRFRSQRQFVNVTVGNEVTYGLGVRMPLAAHGGRFAVLSTLAGAVGLAEHDPEERPLEWLMGAEYHPTDEVTMNLAGGPGLNNGYGTPDFRVVAGISYRRRHAPQPSCLYGPEDLDGFADEDGCADPDNDGDGMADELDMCPNEPETVNGVTDDDGCPETEIELAAQSPETMPPLPEPEVATDSDGDGISDIEDMCPDVAEDADGFEDGDGCPDHDNDGDSVVDSDDKCPFEAETINGESDEDGCPDLGKALVQVTDKKLIILDKVYFDTNKATIQERSFNILNQVASTLRAAPEITKIRIEGHTDARGNDSYNLTLSQNRALSVRDYLLARGIQPERLESQGYGESRPIDTNKTAAGRANNRRVEFIILEVNGQPVEQSTENQ